MSPHPIPSLSGFNPIMSRRVLFGGATAVAAAGVLSACGSSSSKTEHRAGETPLYEINEQDPSKLKQGGYPEPEHLLPGSGFQPLLPERLQHLRLRNHGCYRQRRHLAQHLQG